jgi:hypothetical protein
MFKTTAKTAKIAVAAILIGALAISTIPARAGGFEIDVEFHPSFKPMPPVFSMQGNQMQWDRLQDEDAKLHVREVVEGLTDDIQARHDCLVAYKYKNLLELMISNHDAPALIARTTERWHDAQRACSKSHN